MVAVILVTDDVPTLTTTLRAIIALVDVQSAVSRQSFTTSSAVVIAPVETGADVVAPPFKRKRADVHHVPIFRAGPAQQTVHAQVAKTAHNLRQCFVVGEILEAHGAKHRSSLDQPTYGARSFHRDLVEKRLVPSHRRS